MKDGKESGIVLRIWKTEARQTRYRGEGDGINDNVCETNIFKCEIIDG